MNELPRRKLLEIIAKYGPSIIENPRRLEGLLKDYCGEFRREISVLMMAVEEQAVLDLLAAQADLPREVLLARLARRLCDNLGLSESAAFWSIESWSLALGIISEADIKRQNYSSNSGEGITKQPGSGLPAAAVKAVAAPASKQPANSFTVAANGAGDFGSVAEALKNAPANSRLLIREGIYNEGIVLDKSVEIIGEGAAEKIILRGRHSSALVTRTGQALVRGLTLQGLGAKNGKAFFAVEIAGGGLILENCDVTSDSLSGIAVYGAGTNPSIKNCRIYNCADSGIYIFDKARALVKDCDVYRNSNVGVAITGGAAPVLENCRIFEGDNGGIVAWGNETKGTIEDCQIYGHRLANVGVREHANPMFLRCGIYGGHDTGVFIHENGYGTFEECSIYQNAKAEVGISQNANSVFLRCDIHHGENSGLILQNGGRAQIENCHIYENSDAGVDLNGESSAVIRRCNIHGNRTAVRIAGQSWASVEDCDLRGNFLAAWETEYGITLEESGNRED